MKIVLIEFDTKVSGSEFFLGLAASLFLAA